jgi:hypothetical protein
MTLTLDNEQQRKLLLDLLDRSQFPGAARRLVADLGTAIETATVLPAPAPKPETVGRPTAPKK